MRNSQFDAFGEPLSPLQAAIQAPQGRVSRFVMRAGVGVFWTLVAGIVAARVVYFDPDFARNFATVAMNLVHGALNG